MTTILTLIAILLVGCGINTNTKRQAMPGTYPIAPIFEKFYTELGGQDIIGPPISELFTRDNKQYQYTIAALLVYDPSQPASQRMSLAPIADDWNLSSPVEPEPGDPSAPYLNGHKVWEEVRPFYVLWGSRYMGLPLTSVQFNGEKQRWEQYFENVGFYRNAGDDAGRVYLMPYGDWFCAQYCPYPSVDMVLPTLSAQLSVSEVDAIFEEAATDLYNLPGNPIGDTMIAEDGYYEKPYENVILYADPQNLSSVKLRPLPGMLGMQPSPPVTASPEQGMYFYPVLGDFGYNIPQFFWDYITSHGGLELAGPPITELHPKSDGISWQCYQNYCLEYHQNGPEEARVLPAPLGSQYINHQSPQTSEQPQQTAPMTGMVNLHVWERYPLLSSDQNQEVGVAVSEDGIPLAGVEFTAIVTLIDGTKKSYYMSPSGGNGQTMVTVDLINAPNGSMIPYQICAIGLFDRAVCVEQSFVIWDEP